MIAPQTTTHLHSFYITLMKMTLSNKVFILEFNIYVFRYKIILRDFLIT